jgi:hypothetical protein
VASVTSKHVVEMKFVQKLEQQREVENVHHHKTQGIMGMFNPFKKLTQFQQNTTLYIIQTLIWTSDFIWFCFYLLWKLILISCIKL